jgi:hypothetical protein
MTNSSYHTTFGSIEKFKKGTIEITDGDARHYVFSNVFDVAQQSAAFERVVVGKNLEYVIEALRVEGTSPWFANSHDEFFILLDGAVRIDFIKLDTSPVPADGAVEAGANPAGRKMGYVELRNGHQALLPANCAYRISATGVGAAIIQTRQGALSVEKWAEICLH